MASDERGEVAALTREVQAMREQLGYVQDRQAIQDVMVRYTHLLDCHDWEALQNEVFHPDAVVDYGVTSFGAISGTPRFLCQQLEPIYEREYDWHYHVIGNHWADVQGDTAHAQTYCVTYALRKDGKGIRSLHIRYLDRLEKRQGRWKLALRRMVLDAQSEIPAKQEGVSERRWDRTDPSYQRPFTVPPDRKFMR